MAKGFGRAKRRRETLEVTMDRLRPLNELIPWDIFVELLEKLDNKERKSNAGRKPLKRLLMFKILVLQQLYNLGDDQVEDQIHDRGSFRCFVGFEPAEEVPDAKTIWLFRQQSAKAGLIDELFERFGQFLDEAGYQAQGGQVIDASIIPAPIQRNSKAENEQIKVGKQPPEWSKNAHKLSQKDTDARWTKKNNTNHYGYKDHMNIDVQHKFTRVHAVTDASVHDSQMFTQVLDIDNESDDIWADSAYYSVNMEAALALLGYISHIHERGYRNHPLNDDQKASNREKSKTRARVEHMFGHWVTSMGGKRVRYIGIERVRANQGIKAQPFQGV